VVDATKSETADVMMDLQSIITDRDLSHVPLLVLVNKVSDGGKFLFYLYSEILIRQRGSKRAVTFRYFYHVFVLHFTGLYFLVVYE
jgi:hypothetical protein